MDNLGFWANLKKPIMALAPMANVTDSAFRQIIARYGKPDVFWTEFISADGLCSAGREHLEPDLYFTEIERPIVLQLFGSNPSTIRDAAAMARERGFDGVDINMGCPDKAVEKQGAGAHLIKNPELAKEIIKAAKEGAQKLPVSVKTRIGYSRDITEEWTNILLATKPALISFHLRTRREMSKTRAHWDALARAVAIRNATKSETLIFGNGDIMSIAEAKDRAGATGADGVMMGRAIFGNPWFFSGKDRADIPLTERLSVMAEHAELFQKLFSATKHFAIMKKHFKAYAADFDGAKELRLQLMNTESVQEVCRIISNFRSSPKGLARLDAILGKTEP